MWRCHTGLWELWLLDALHAFSPTPSLSGHRLCVWTSEVSTGSRPGLSEYLTPLASVSSWQLTYRPKGRVRPTEDFPWDSCNWDKLMEKVFLFWVVEVRNTGGLSYCLEKACMPKTSPELSQTKMKTGERPTRFRPCLVLVPQGPQTSLVHAAAALPVYELPLCSYCNPSHPCFALISLHCVSVASFWKNPVCFNRLQGLPSWGEFLKVTTKYPIIGESIRRFSLNYLL